jgi:radical SAM protein with 4Fe4S-binding SPASM domain
MEILRGQFLENARRGLINEDPDNPKWLIQRCLFETLIRCFMRRVIAPAKGPCLNGRSRLDATCTPTWFTYFMNVNGDYYLCERASPCEEFRIGNVRTGVDVDRCYAIKRKYVEMCDDQCRHCWCLNFCHVGCYTSLASEEGLTAVSKRAACNRYREAVHHMLTDLFGVLESNPHAFDYLKRKAGSRTTAGHDA